MQTSTDSDIAILSPGQGAQRPNMLADWIRSTRARKLVDAMSDAAGVDLVAAQRGDDSSAIRDTALVQPLIVACGTLALVNRTLSEGSAVTDRTIVAGHSVGELTAAVAAGILAPLDAVRIAAVRGRAMAAASASVETAMAAILGGDRSIVEALATECGVFVSNYNCPGEVVVAGRPRHLENLRDRLPDEIGIRPLEVSGAFHTPYMESAVEAVADAFDTIEVHDPRCEFVGNGDGRPVTDAGDFVRRFLSQMTRPVHWDLCMETVTDRRPARIVHLPPTRITHRLQLRTCPDIPSVRLDGPRQAARGGLPRDVVPTS